MTAADGRTDRQRWMAVLARATAADLEHAIGVAGGLAGGGAGEFPGHTVLKPAETGTVMIEARAGGTGRRFNLGEAAVTRCVVRLDTGTLGVAYGLGLDRRKALLAAVLDGLLQDPVRGLALAAAVVGPLAASQRAARDLASRKAAATRVDFFTLVRGDE